MQLRSEGRGRCDRPQVDHPPEGPGGSLVTRGTMVRHARLEGDGGTLVHTRFGSIERFVFPNIGLSWMDKSPEE